MSRKMEVVHVEFLRHMIGKKKKWQRDWTWISEAAARVLNKAVTHTLGDYIDKRQETVVEWVALRTILDICNRETGYEGGVRRREPWWWHTVAQKKLSMTLKYILAATRAWRW